MAINSVSNATSTLVQSAEYSTKTAESTKASETSTTETTGVVYEKSSSSDTTTTKISNSALVAKLKADAEERTSQLRGIVEKMMLKQGNAIANADSMWSFLASGDYTVDAATKAQAQADIADDGYWGVEQTSDRILDFAIALSGNDPEKADELLEAFKEGFAQATKSWGDTLPEISQHTYDAVLEKFDAWKNSAADSTEA